MKHNQIWRICLVLTALSWSAVGVAQDIVHDAEY